MIPKETTCEQRRIELFLRQQLSDAEQSVFESHLESCTSCRLELESQAARAEDWAVARESLGSDVLEFSAPETRAGIPGTDSNPDADEEEALCRPDSVLNFLSPTDDPRMIGRLGNYEIVGIVGQGGMGIVFKGLDPALNRYVAIKALAPHLAASGAARRRFAREAQAAAAVTHDNVVAIHGVAEWNGLPYLVMPYVRGESLQKRLDQQGPRGLNEILRVGLQIAAGLTAAHAQGLVHRDIKPANILLEDGIERLKITDFGLARAVDDASLTRTGIIAGTPQYMSPEQARGEAIDSRSDLFSLGSVLYAMCTGRPPFRAETSYGILRRITDTEPRPIREINPDIPDWLEGIINRLLAKAPSMRFASASEVAEIFEQCLAHVQQPTTVALPPTCRPQSGRFRFGFRFGLRYRIATAVALLAGGLGIMMYAQGRRTIQDDPNSVQIAKSEAETVGDPNESITPDT
ncbi:MAG: prkC 20, partial [Planctomycetaceae bacterium]|nr:prkC 20 [Planctomycetaceae bacterium]